MDQFLFFAHILKLTIKTPKLVQKCPKMVKIAIITLDLGSSASITYIKRFKTPRGLWQGPKQYRIKFEPSYITEIWLKIIKKGQNVGLSVA